MLEHFENYKIQNPNYIFGGNSQTSQDVGNKDVQTLGAISLAT